ncbi:adenylate/guanylate cyclase domain-containing protein [Ensifer sp. T173]|uniref:Adenylate/guanylate cyclase domain-containing protein n=1 Tax=Ensifer canadensis TaxID=555315 RepID=A0AAW4FE59_9HYPH|nr:adenylate/guanylate cyclase domain-containing protein [Ensifer canadensis]MBM3090419.1 adenylate/guanylate cyclase domain-containing protein [Ensifer canadensis]UBI80211.1 adenylate/guanylate cyclase domain-containing protein [Ensifer canadensis]
MRSSLSADWDFERETRSILLRFVAFAILLANLLLGGGAEAEGTHFAVIICYLVISIASVMSARFLPGRSWLKTLFVVLDALLVALILYAHILGGPVTENHNVTTSSLVVAFILLNHVGLKLDRRLVLVFSGIVLVAWIGMLAVTGARHHTADAVSFVAYFFNQDLGLTVSYGFTAFAIYLLAKDHDKTRKEALLADRRRLNLSRFFSPLVVADLQEGSSALELERRNAVIMFVDLRDFTSFAETAPARQLAAVLAQYRHLVSGIIFDHGGTVDKFIGDGVMAVFGQPTAMKDDADRALACALDLVDALNDWKHQNLVGGYPALSAGIGLHYGSVVGGVLDSGCHSEFTVIGDAVNVAQRLEALTKVLGSPLVVSSALVKQLRKPAPSALWTVQNEVALAGRRLPIDIWYLQTEVDSSVPSPVAGGAKTPLQRPSLQSSPFTAPDVGIG